MQSSLPTLWVTREHFGVPDATPRTALRAGVIARVQHDRHPRRGDDKAECCVSKDDALKQDTFWL